MMARAASAQSAGCILGRAATILPTGNGSRMTPVEKGRTWEGLQPVCSAVAAQVSMASILPCAPVPALALPVLMMMARTPSSSKRCDLAMWTGAAQKRLVVNTAPTVLPPESTIRVRSARSACLMPARAVKSWMPSMFSSWSAVFSVRLTAILLLLCLGLFLIWFSDDLLVHRGRLKSVQNPNTGMIIGAMAAVSTPLRVSPSPAYAAMRRLRSSEAAMPMACEAVPSDMPTDEGMTTVFLSTV